MMFGMEKLEWCDGMDVWAMNHLGDTVWVTRRLGDSHLATWLGDRLSSDRCCLDELFSY